MNTRKLFLTSLLAAATMSVPAFGADATWSGTEENTDWSGANWTKGSSGQTIDTADRAVFTSDTAGKTVTGTNVTAANLKIDANGNITFDGSFSFTSTNSAYDDSQNWGTMNLAENAVVSFAGNLAVARWGSGPGSGPAPKVLNIASGAVLSVARMARADESLKLVNNGIFKVGELFYRTGGGNLFEGSGTVIADTFSIGNVATVNFENNKLILGSGGIVQKEVQGNLSLSFGAMTLGASANWSSAQGITFNAASGKKTIIDTSAYDTTNYTTSETDGKTITLSGTLSVRGAVEKIGAGTLELAGTVNVGESGSIALTAGTLKLASTGTLNGTISATGGTLELAGTLNLTSAISVADSVSMTVANTAVFVLSDSLLQENEASTWNVITGADSISGWNASTLGLDNFRKADGSRFGGRSEFVITSVGSVAITDANANIVWAASSASASTWNMLSSNTIWTNSDDDDKATSFYAKDNVTFDNTASYKQVTLEDGSALEVGNMTIASGTQDSEGNTIVNEYTFQPATTDSASASISGNTLTVEASARMNVKTVNLLFDDIVLAGTLQLDAEKFSSSSTLNWSKMTFKGGTFYILDTQSRDRFLAIGEVVMSGNGAIKSKWSRSPGVVELAIGTLSGSGDLSITGGTKEPINYSIGTIDSGYSGTISLIKSTDEGAKSVELSVGAATLAGATSASISVGEGTTLAISTSTTGEVALGNVSGAGTLKFAGVGNLTDSGGEDPAFSTVAIGSGFTGTVEITAGLVDMLENSDEASAILPSRLGSASKVVLNGGGLLFRNVNNTTQNNNKGTFTTEIEVGASGGVIRVYGNGNVTIASDISGAGTLKHTDGGVLTLTGTVNLTGGFSQVTGTVSGNITATTTFAGANTTLGTLNVSAGIANFTGASTTVTTANISGGKLTLSGASVSIGTLNTSANTVIGTSDSATVKLASGQLSLGVLTLQGNGHSLSVESGTVVSVERFWGSAGEGAITTAISGVLNVSGSVNSAHGNAAAFLMANSGGTNTISVEDGGVLNLANAGVSNRDGTGVLNIKTGGEANFGAGLYVLTWNATWGRSTVNLDGGTLNVGGNSSGVGISTDGKSNVAVNLKSGTLGSLSDSWSTALGFALEGALTIDTTKKEIFASGKATATDSGSNVAFEGVISDATDSTGSLKKAGAGTLKLSGNNTYSGGTTISAGRLVAANEGALGTGVVTVERDAELGLVAGVTVTGVTGGIELAENAKLVIDMTGQTAGTEDIVLTLISNTALDYNGTGSFDTTGMLGSVVVLENLSETLNAWTQSLSYADNTLSLTLTIPEPSTFGLLAGLGALALAGTRRRRRKA